MFDKNNTHVTLLNYSTEKTKAMFKTSEFVYSEKYKLDFLPVGDIKRYPQQQFYLHQPTIEKLNPETLLESKLKSFKSVSISSYLSGCGFGSYASLKPKSCQFYIDGGTLSLVDYNDLMHTISIINYDGYEAIQQIA